MFLLALLVGLGIVLAHIVFFVAPKAVEMDEMRLLFPEKAGASYPSSLYNMWIGGGVGYTVYPTWYFTLFPLLACLPFTASLHIDRHSGYVKQLATRVTKRKYYIAKAVSVFLSSGAAVVLPLMIDVFLTAQFFSALKPEPTTSTFAVRHNSMWNELFYTHPLVYVILYLCMDFLFVGLLGLIAMCFTWLVRNRVFIVITPFILLMFFDFLIGTFRLEMGISPSIFLRADQPGQVRFFVIVIEFAVLLLLCGWFLMRRAKRDEIY